MNDEEGFVSDKKYMEEDLLIESENKDTLGLGLGLGLGLEEKLKTRTEDAKKKKKKKRMEVGCEEVDKSGGSNRKSKQQLLLDSDDDEPIGALFKLKKYRNPKRVKSDKVAKVNKDEEDDLGEMEDTLASLRKKLKGPKLGKDGAKTKCSTSKKVDQVSVCSGEGSDSFLDFGLKRLGTKFKVLNDPSSGTGKRKDSGLGVGGMVLKEQDEEIPTCSGEGSGLLLDMGLGDMLKRRGKKSKDPKMGKDGGSGSGKGKNSDLLSGLRLTKVEDSPTYSGHSSDLLFDVGSADMSNPRRKRSKLALMLKKAEDCPATGDALAQCTGIEGYQMISTKKQKEKVSVVRGSCNHSSDENLEFSLSEFIRKSQSGSVKKARSSSTRKKRKVTPVSGDGLDRRSDGVSEHVPRVVIGEPPSTTLNSEILVSDVKLNLASHESLADRSLVKETLETQSPDGRHTQSYWIREDRESSLVKELVPSLETAEGVVRSIAQRCKEPSEGISGDPVSQSSLLRPHYGFLTNSKEKRAPPNAEESNKFNKPSKGISGHPVPMSSPSRSCSGSLADTGDEPTTPNSIAFDKQMTVPEALPRISDVSPHPSAAASEDLLSGQVLDSCFGTIRKFTAETQSFKNGLRHCSNGEDKRVPESHDDGLTRASSKILEDLPSSIVLISAEVNMDLSAGHNDMPFTEKTTSEPASFVSALDHSSGGIPVFCPSNATEEPSASFAMPENEVVVRCSDRAQLGRSYCLNQPSENTPEELSGEKLSSRPFKTEAEDIARYDEVAQPFVKELEGCSLIHIMQRSCPVSPLVKMAEDHQLDGLVKFSDRCLGNSQLQPSLSAFVHLEKGEFDTETHGLYRTPGTSLEEFHVSPSQKRVGETSRIDVVLQSGAFAEESVAADDVSHDLCDDFVQVYSSSPLYKSSDDALRGSHASYQDHVCAEEEAKFASSQSIDLEPTETIPEDAGKTFDRENKERKLLPVQRAVRKVKKRRHGDMAYEGDTDWDFLIHGQGFFENSRVLDGDRPPRTKDKFDYSSNMGIEADNCGIAAVAAGLKVRAAGPLEKIRFKDILKRRGGLSEYLECRNLILSLWSRDMSRILSLTDCGVTDVPSEIEPPQASLIREIYAFLNHHGYINVGIAYEKEKTEPESQAQHSTKSTKSCGPQIADSDDRVAFIFGQVKACENCIDGKKDTLSNSESSMFEATKSKELLVTGTGSECALVESEECVVNNEQENGWIDVKRPNRVVNLEALTNPSSEVVDDGPDSLFGPDQNRDSCGIQSTVVDLSEGKSDIECNLKVQKRIIVIGAGPAGLTAARHLQRQGFAVTVLEARDRLGGRVYTDRSSLSVPVDLGASIITGVEADVATERRPDPSSLICSQLGLELTVLNSDCPLYDIVTGQKVPAGLDEALEAEYNSLLDDMVVLVAQKGERAMRMSLEDGLEYALRKRRVRLKSESEEFGLDTSMNASFAAGANDHDRKIPNRISSKEEEVLSPLERRVMNWHFANLEYGCAALLKEVSLPYWNQDDVYGGFGGAHCMIKGGYSTVVESLGKGLNIYLNHVVTGVSYSMKEAGETDETCSKVKVSMSNGKEVFGDAVLVTVPLGCLKANTIAFSPSLPEWKQSSIRQLGFGVLNKVVLQFPEVFWDDSVDYFGATAEQTDWRGKCFMFWNVKKTVGAPVLIALVVGKAAIDGENMASSDHVNHALKVLRKLFGDASVPVPVASVVTNWGQDPFSRGAYSYVAVGASGEDYDILGRPVGNCLFFAGEATCKEHPDTVGGAMMSGLREAVRIIDILNTGDDHMAEVEAMEAAQRQSESERNEVRDILKRLEAVELSNVLCKSSFDGDRMLTKEALLQDMFHNAKTTAGRLHLAKKLLNLPVEALKSFAGTKKGLSILNSWILDSMGKDGTQLLRHCVRLLVLVSTNLLAVRLSGIGRTVKEKVCVHTSRDIRAVASQLVSVWIEVFRKQKAANGGLKLLRQASASDSLKNKSSKDSTGKLLCMTQSASFNRGNTQVPSSPRRNSSLNTNIKKVNGKTVKLEASTDSKAERQQLHSRTVETLQSKGEDNNVVMSEEEAAAFAAAEAARAAALAAAEAFASKEAECSTLRDLPKIPSFHKFARREQYAQMDDTDLRKKWSGGVLGRQDCLSDIDSRNCKVRNWSVDFSAACANLDSSRMSGDNYTQQSYSNEVMYQGSFREHSGESVATDCRLTKAWVDSAGSGGIKDYHAIERWQSQAAAADSDFFHSTLHIRDEEDSNKASKPVTRKPDRGTEKSAASQPVENQEVVDNQPRGVEPIKKAVVDYVGSLLMPLYKARKIDKEGYKSIMKKSATKVMEQTTDSEKLMSASEFLDYKRKNKIRAFVDKLIEKHMAMTPVDKP